MTLAPSPFHPFERAIQARLGVSDKLGKMGAKFIRDEMPEQHQEFFQGLAYLFAGWRDEQGRLWASVLPGSPGFVDASDPRTLNIDLATTADDPFKKALVANADLGFLGLDFSNRRRNRVNGHIVHADHDTLTVTVDQSFGNCPKYIQVREMQSIHRPTPSKTGAEFTTFTARETNLINAADSFYIASGHKGKERAAGSGIDVSHRGGTPGFVHLTDNQTLIFPDFRGNFFFNTLGNLESDDRAGLLLIDFATGNLLQLTGHARTRWNHDPSIHQGADRLVTFTLSAARWLDGHFYDDWSVPEPSPFLKGMGWQER